MVRVTDQYFWNFVFAVFFATLVGVASVMVMSAGYRSLEELTLLDFALVALASQRLVRLFVYDTAMKWFREQFYDAKVTKAGKVTLYKPATGPRRTLVDLFSCPWCFGLWATFMVSVCYLMTPYAYYVVILLALSSVTSVLQIGSNLLGHKAERAKYEVEG